MVWPDAEASTRRERLLEAAFNTLETRGPEAISTRKLGAAIGKSSSAVYAEFGSLAGLVAAVVDAGFDLLDQALTRVGATDDPIADLWLLLAGYRQFAHDRPFVFQAIYGLTRVGGYQRRGSEMLQGTGVFLRVIEAVERAIASGRFRDQPSYDVAYQLWVMAHGFAVAEVTGYAEAFPPTAGPSDEGAFLTVMVGLGDSAEAARGSLRAAQRPRT